MKRLVSLFLAVAMLLCITGCQNNTKSEKEIKEDVLSEVEAFEKYDMLVNGFEITSRKTDTTAKTDTIYCSVAAENDILQYTANFVISYRLYDQGWLFENLETANREVVPTKSTITKEIAQKDIEEHGYYEEALESYRYKVEDYNANLNLNLSFDKEVLDLEDGWHQFYFVDYSAKFMCILYYKFSYNWSLYGVDYMTFSQYEAYYGAYNK